MTTMTATTHAQSRPKVGKGLLFDTSTLPEVDESLPTMTSVSTTTDARGHLQVGHHASAAVSLRIHFDLFRATRKMRRRHPEPPTLSTFSDFLRSWPLAHRGYNADTAWYVDGSVHPIKALARCFHLDSNVAPEC